MVLRILHFKYKKYNYQYKIYWSKGLVQQIEHLEIKEHSLVKYKKFKHSKIIKLKNLLINYKILNKRYKNKNKNNNN